MKIKEIVIAALNLLGRGDAASAMEKGETLSEEAALVADSLLYCVNAVLDELARYYFPLKFKETIYLNGGKAAFADFTYGPVKILNVTAYGKKIKYTADPQYITAEASQIEVEYEYAPAKKLLDEDCDYSGAGVSARLVAAGAVSEFCIINGEVSAAEYWEGEYRREIDRARAKLRVPLRIPPGRWV